MHKKILPEKYGYPLLLTGTIDPRMNDDENRSIEKRVQQYENSLKRYICETQFNPIVFVENSEYPFDVLKFERMAEQHGKVFEFVKGTICKEQVKQDGKGYGDALLIYEGITKSKAFEDVDIFYKMTGRVFLKNSQAIIKTRDCHRNEFIAYDGMGWCMTYIFKSNKADYLRILGNVYTECDDRSLRDIEICFWLRLQKSNLDIGSFSTYPDIEGNMGETEKPYTRSQAERIARTLLIKTGVFTMNSKASRLFWRIYIKISKRNPYATND